MDTTDSTGHPTAADLEARWQETVRTRRTCECTVCTLPDDTRAFVDTKLRELSRLPQNERGRHGLGVSLLANRVTLPLLGIALSTLIRHRSRCLEMVCATYAGASDDQH